MEVRETDPRFLFLRGKLILFAGIALMGTLIVLFFIAKQKRLFVKTDEVYFIADRATGLYTGMPVKVSGFTIGRLKSMKLRDDARVLVTLSIDASEMRWLREGSYAILKKEGLIGESVIEIIPGSGRPLRTGGEVSFEKQKGIEEMAGELKAEITDILKEIKKLLVYINEPEGDIKRTLSNMERISADLIKATDSLNRLLEELNKRTATVGSKAESALSSADRRLEELSGLIKTAKESLEDIHKQLLETTKTLRETTQKASKDVPRLLRQTEKGLQDMEEILESIKGLWPIRKGIRRQEIRIIEGDTAKPYNQDSQEGNR